MEYNLITHWNQSEFIANCDELLKKGWALQGGVSISHQSSNSTIYAQAFVRPVK